MKYFKDKNNEIYAYSDLSIKEKIKNLVEISEKEADEILKEKNKAEVINVTSVTMRQARLILHNQKVKSGKLENKTYLELVDTVLDSLDEPLKTNAKIEWEYALKVEIDNPLIEVMKKTLELSDDDIQLMFNEASKL